MYRSRRITEFSKSCNDSSTVSSDENKENDNSIVNKNFAKDESITDAFKKLTLTVNADPMKNCNTAFVTSSPIRSRLSVDKCPKFIKTELISPLTVKNIMKAESQECEHQLPCYTESGQGNKQGDIKKESLESLKLADSKLVIRSHNSSKKPTVPIPFSFANKDKALLENRQKLLNNDLLEKKRLASAFRANPAPFFSPQKVAATTKLVEDRALFLQEKLQSKIKLEVSVCLNNSIISTRTKDLTYMYNSPFKPTQSTLTPTCPETPRFVLKSRSERWKELDAVRKAEEEERLTMIKEEEAANTEREKNELKQIRESRIVRANSIRNYKKVEIVHNPKKTVPITPKFSERFKK